MKVTNGTLHLQQDQLTDVDNPSSRINGYIFIKNVSHGLMNGSIENDNGNIDTFHNHVVVGNLDVNRLFVDEPVCGTDYVTYGSHCLLRQVSCHRRQNTRVQYLGPCKTTKVEEGQFIINI